MIQNRNVLEKNSIFAQTKVEFTHKNDILLKNRNFRGIKKLNFGAITDI